MSTAGTLQEFDPVECQNTTMGLALPALFVMLSSAGAYFYVRRVKGLRKAGKKVMGGDELRDVLLERGSGPAEQPGLQVQTK